MLLVIAMIFFQAPCKATGRILTYTITIFCKATFDLSGFSSSALFFEFGI